MKATLAVDYLVSREYNSQPRSHKKEEIKMIVNNLTIEKLPQDELLKKRLEFEKKAIPHIKLLFNYALKITGNRFDADILLRDTYVRAFRYFHKFNEGKNCKQWLGRIMRNCYINMYMREKEKRAQLGTI